MYLQHNRIINDIFLTILNHDFLLLLIWIGVIHIGDKRRHMLKTSYHFYVISKYWQRRCHIFNSCISIAHLLPFSIDAKNYKEAQEEEKYVQ